MNLIDLIWHFFIDPVEWSNGFLYFFSTLAQCAASFAALVAVFAVFRFQANGDIVQRLCDEAAAWLEYRGETRQSDRVSQVLIHKRLKEVCEGTRPYSLAEAKILLERLESAQEFPKKLAQKLSVPLKHWALICFFSALCLMIFEIKLLRREGLLWLAVIWLVVTTKYVFYEMRDFIQDCLKS